MKQGLGMATCVATVLLLAAHHVAAQTSFDSPREFVMDQACDAYTSLRKQTGAEALPVGQTYTAVGENKQPDATHTLVQLGSGQKWVALTCGHYTGAAPTPAATNRDRASCLPFFDNADNPVAIKVGGKADITPPAPSIDAFGQALNTTCGAAGKSVSPEEFKSLLRSNPDVLGRIQAFTQGKVYADRPAQTTVEGYLNDLTEAWFAVHAFDHIFCGEPEGNGPIGGLHYVGRYVQLQQSGEACRMDNFRQNEVVPGVIYSMGAIMKTPAGGLARSSIKGYGLTLSAEDILKAATRAFAENPAQSADKSTACLLPLGDDGKQFTTVFVRRKSGIRTFYPDATPAVDDPACVAGFSL